MNCSTAEGLCLFSRFLATARDLSDVLVVSLLWDGAGAAVGTSGHVKVQGASWTLQP